MRGEIRAELTMKIELLDESRISIVLAIRGDSIRTNVASHNADRSSGKNIED